MDAIQTLIETAAAASSPPEDGWSFEVELGEGVRVLHTYFPTEPQRKFHQARARYVLFGGAVGPGKTRALCEHVLISAVRWPGIPILVLRRDLKDIKKSTEVEWLKVCPPELYAPEYGGQRNKSEHFYRLYNGSIIYFGEAKDWNSYKSAEVGLIAIDELSEIDEEFYANIDSRLRWTTGKGVCRRTSCLAYDRTHPEHPFYQIVAATNPAANWVKERWYDPYIAGKELPNHAFIPATTFDNPHLAPDYIPNLVRTHSREWVQNYIYGNWSSFENQVFPDLKPSTHGWDPSAPLPPFVAIDGGIDWGNPSAPNGGVTACVLAGRTQGGDIVVFKLYSKKGASSNDAISWIQTQTRLHNVRRWYADSSQFTAIRLLRERGIPVAEANRGPNSVASDIGLIKRYADAGKLRILTSLAPLWRAIEGYTYDPATQRPLRNQPDDELDALRYCMQSITVGPGYGPPEASAAYRLATDTPREMTPMERIRAQRSLDYQRIASRS